MIHEGVNDVVVLVMSYDTLRRRSRIQKLLNIDGGARGRCVIDAYYVISLSGNFSGVCVSVCAISIQCARII